MSLRQLLHSYARPKAARDRRLKPLDYRIYSIVYDRAPWSVARLVEELQLGKETVRRAVTRLEKAGWVHCYVEPGRVRGRLIYPSMPVHVEEAVASMLTQRRTTVAFFGEWLMRCLLDFFVADWRYIDDAHPDWLITPQGNRLQLDRWYTEGNIAFEFQGAQHFQKDDRFIRTDDELSRRLRYDGEKIRLCSLQGIELVEVQGLDLDIDVFQEKIRGKLPLIPVRRTGPLYRQLIGMTRQYVNYVRN